jgi:tetratricopeptide (TPR) repeat protein
MTVTRDDSSAGPRPPEPPEDTVMRARIAGQLFGDAPALGDPLQELGFQDVRPLGRGGMGVVARAFDPKLERHVAIKTIAPGRLGSEGEDERLLREAQALARISHPNVVAVHAVLQSSTGLHIVMELVEGTRLDEWQVGRRIPEIVDAYRQAALGLHAAHAVGLVHRDFKPSNVMVGEDGRVRVLDFGLVRVLGSRDATGPTAAHGDDDTGVSPSLTRTGARLGTLAYMAPEQMRGEAVDPRADQFSLCVALFTAVFGRAPFRGTTMADRLNEIEVGVRRDLPIGRVSRRVRRAMLRGLQASPVARHASMLDLAAALERGRPTRGLWIVVAGLVLAGGAIPLSVGSPDPCVAAQESVRALWSLEHAGQVEDAFRATGVEESAQAFTIADGRMRASIEAWSHAHRASCEGVQSDKGVEEAEIQQCLGIARDRLEVTAAILADADGQLVLRVDEVVGPHLEVDCATALGRRRVVAPIPPPLASAPDIADARRELERARVREHAGRFEEALEQAVRARSMAVDTGYAPVIAEAAFEVARLHERHEQPDLARAAALEATRAAIQSDHQEVFASALLVLARAELRDGAIDRAESMTTMAEASVQRLGAPADAMARLAATRGLVAGRAGRTDDAERDFREASRALTASGLRREARAAEINLASLLTDAGRPTEGYAKYQEIAQAARAELGAAHPELALLEYNTGVAALDLGELDDARAHLERALDLNGRGFGEKKVPVSTTLLALGVVAQQQGDWEAAWSSSAKLAALATLPTPDPVAAGRDSLMLRANAASAVCLPNVAQDAYRELLGSDPSNADIHERAQVLVGNLELAHLLERASRAACAVEGQFASECLAADGWMIAADAAALALRGALADASEAREALAGYEGHLERLLGHRALLARDFEVAVTHLGRAVDLWSTHGGAAQAWVLAAARIELAIALVGRQGGASGRFASRIKALLEVARSALARAHVQCPDSILPWLTVGGRTLEEVLGSAGADAFEELHKAATADTWHMEPVLEAGELPDAQVQAVVALVNVPTTRRRGDDHQWPLLRDVVAGRHGWTRRCPKPKRAWCPDVGSVGKWLAKRLGDRSIARCTGVVVGDHLVLTAMHCLNGVSPRALRIVPGYLDSDTRMSPAEGAVSYRIVHAFAPPEHSLDWVLLEVAPVDGADPWPATVGWGSDSDPLEIRSLGFPFGVPMQVSVGALASEHEMRDAPMLTTLDAVDYSSGSPVFGEDGLLGLVMGTGDGALACGGDTCTHVNPLDACVVPVRRAILDGPLETYKPAPTADEWQKKNADTDKYVSTREFPLGGFDACQ